MKKALSVYNIAYLILLMIGLGLLLTYPKLELHLMLNSWHTGVFDTFFKYYSILAEWPFYIIALLPLLWKKKEMTIFYAISELSAGLVTVILKRIFCMERPATAFENCPDLVLPVVEGVNLHHSNSFPSGHASTFFVFFTCCAIILAYRHVQKTRQSNKSQITFHITLLLLLVLAVLGAYSRIYLSQHFLSDICMGSFIGFTTPFVVFYFCRHKILKLKNV